MSVMVVLALAAFIATVVHAMGKAPLWVAVLILSLMQLLSVLPIGRT